MSHHKINYFGDIEVSCQMLSRVLFGIFHSLNTKSIMLSSFITFSNNISSCSGAPSFEGRSRYSSKLGQFCKWPPEFCCNTLKLYLLLYDSCEGRVFNVA